MGEEFYLQVFEKPALGRALNFRGVILRPDVGRRARPEFAEGTLGQYFGLTYGRRISGENYGWTLLLLMACPVLRDVANGGSAR
jgi:hypothetical protein